MPKVSLQEKIAKENKKLEQAKARLQTLKAKSRNQSKKDETRAKILLGAWVLKSWEGLSETERAKELKKVDSFLTRDKDKELVPRVVAALLANDKELKS